MSKRAVRGVVGSFLLVAGALGLTASFLPGKAARASSDTVAGRIASKPVLCAPGSGSVLCTTGTMTGNVEGPFSLTVHTVAPSGVSDFSVMTTNVVANTAEGDLSLKGVAVADLHSGRFVGLVEVTGGTGRFEKASGQIRWWTGPTADGRREGEYSGVITVR